MAWITTRINERRKLKEIKEKEWHVTFSSDGGIWLAAPNSYYSGRFPKWASVETRIYSRMQQHWPQSHTYLRLLTYRTPDSIITSLADKLPTYPVDWFLFVIPDCQDERVWDSFFASGTLDTGEIIFTLNYKPRIYAEKVIRLGEMVQNLYHGKPVTAFEAELSDCYCLCYCIDADLIFAKVDLPEDEVVSILKDIALEENLDLIVQRS